MSREEAGASRPKNAPKTKIKQAHLKAAWSQWQALVRRGVVRGGPWAGPPPKLLRLMGPPISRARQRRLGISRFVPGIGYRKWTCGRCQKRLWLGPQQIKYLRAEPATEVICQTCVEPELAAGLRDGTVALTHLGGRGGGYYQGGKYFGPPEETNN